MPKLASKMAKNGKIANKTSKKVTLKCKKVAFKNTKNDILKCQIWRFKF